MSNCRLSEPPTVVVGAELAKYGSLTLSAATTGGVACSVLAGSDVARIADSHRRVACAQIARVADVAPAFAVFDDEVVSTLDACVRALPKQSVPYPEAIAVTWTLARALAHAHARGLTFGALGLANVLVTSNGTLKLIGLGADATQWASHAVIAPSVALGRAPTPVTDVYAGLLLLRSLVPWMSNIPDILARLLAAESGPAERTFQSALSRALTLSGPANGSAALSALEKFWRIVGVVPDEAALAARLRGLWERSHLRIDSELRWFSVNSGTRVDLSRREPARRVLRALIESAPHACSVDGLVRAGWPGPAPVGNSGADRLYVLVSSLRDLGLRDLILRSRDGYKLRDDVTIIRV